MSPNKSDEGQGSPSVLRKSAPKRGWRRTTGAKYAISSSNLKYGNLRQLLRVYRYWLESNGDIDAAAKKLHAWIKKTNEKRCAWEAKRKESGKESYWVMVGEAGWEKYEKGEIHGKRFTLTRYLRKARRIAASVAKGVFPGKISN